MVFVLFSSKGGEVGLAVEILKTGELTLAEAKYRPTEG